MKTDIELTLTMSQTISGFGFGIGAGLGNAEFSITAYPGICLHDQYCWGNLRGQVGSPQCKQRCFADLQTYKWLQTTDTSPRSVAMYGNNSVPWDFRKQQPANFVVINLGTNDNNTVNDVGGPTYYESYIKLIDEVHHVWPEAQVIIQTLWNGFYQSGNMWYQSGGFIEEIPAVERHYQQKYGRDNFVHLFNTTGILQHNDIDPEYHPTDVGHVKVASHVLQYLRIKFGLELAATGMSIFHVSMKVANESKGPEIQSHTLYWNTEQFY